MLGYRLSTDPGIEETMAATTDEMLFSPFVYLLVKYFNFQTKNAIILFAGEVIVQLSVLWKCTMAHEMFGDSPLSTVSTASTSSWCSRKVL